jgi:hypothetical protein
MPLLLLIQGPVSESDRLYTIKPIETAVAGHVSFLHRMSWREVILIISKLSKMVVDDFAHRI